MLSSLKLNTTGENRYVAPGPNDLQGPCPGKEATVQLMFRQEKKSATPTGRPTAQPFYIKVAFINV